MSQPPRCNPFRTESRLIDNTLPTADDNFQSPVIAPLLISVRSLEEALLASRFPLAIIDFKDPCGGPLGRCSDAILEGVTTLPKRGLGFSAACGELSELQQERFAKPSILPSGFQFAKAGPAGLSDVSQLTDALQWFRSSLLNEVTPVAVAYADHLNADSLPAETIVELAIQLRYRWLLFDTATKDGRRLLDWIPMQQLTELLGRCREHGIRTVLAGSLSMQDIASLRPLGADLLGIRGAVCTAGRSSCIDPQKLARWCRAMTTTDAPVTQ